MYSFNQLQKSNILKWDNVMYLIKKSDIYMDGKIPNENHTKPQIWIEVWFISEEFIKYGEMMQILVIM